MNNIENKKNSCDGNEGFDTLRVFEAFAGYGSQSLALRNLGIPHKVVAISEIDKYAIKAYYALHDKNIPNLGDISKINVEDIPEHDLFTYSFPCQDLSVAGKQAGLSKGTRSGLLYECEKIIEYCRPKYLLLENVKNLVGKKFKPQFDEWLEYLEGLGYTNYWKVLNAKDYGIPQNRERVFVISILEEHKPYKFPNNIELKLRLKDILEDVVDEKYYVSKEIQDKFRPNKNIKDVIDSPIRLGGLFDTDKSKHQAGSVWDTEKISPTIDTMQGGWRQPCIIDTTNVIGKLDCKGWHDIETRVHGTNGVSPTIETRNRGKYMDDNNGRIRKLTPRECFRLMGMRDDDIDKIQRAGISNTQQYKMAGNSIVVDVLEAIFRNLFLD